MADSNIGSGGNDILVPEEQAGSIDVVELNFEIDGEEISGTEVAIAAPVSELTTKILPGESFVFAGKKQSDSTITIKKSEEGSASVLRLENTLNDNVEIKAKKGNTIDLRIAEGKFRKSEFTAGKGKQEDSVEIGSSAKLINSSFDLNKGDDTFTLSGGVKLKGTNTVDLGKGGTDTVIIGQNTTGKGKLVIENMDKRDTLSYGGEEYTKKQILKGEADLPGFLELG